MRSTWPIVLLCAVASTASGQHLAVSANGLNSGDEFGAAACRAHDFDHDGTDDLVVGAPGFDFQIFANSGAVFVVSGANGAILASTPGGAPLEALGASVLSIADVTGDGVRDVAAGAPGSGGINPPGAIRILSGATLTRVGILVGPGPGARIGEQIASLGDFSGDGKDEIAAGARTFDNGVIAAAGAVVVFNSTTGSPIIIASGQSAFEGFGTSIDVIPDLTSDGIPELLVGAPGADPQGKNGAGAVSIIEPVTGATIRQYPGLVAGDGLGVACAGIGDVDGDAISDVLAGAPTAAPGGIGFAGSAILYSGQNGIVIRRFDGLTMNDQFGSTIAALGDLDFDGTPEYAVGSPSYSLPGLPAAGRVYVGSGSSGNLVYLFDGTAANAQYGGAVFPIGDLNGDLRRDFAIGWPAADLSAADAGRIEIRYSQFPSLKVTTTGKFGSSVEIDVTSKPVTSVFLLINASSNPMQTPLGMLCVAMTPTLVVLSLGATGIDGQLTWPGTIPSIGIPPGSTFWLQAAMFDPFAPSLAWVGNCTSVTCVP